MGIRVHKALGWGLTDVKSREGAICDKRFSTYSILKGDYEKREEEFTYEKYLKWLI